MLRQSCIKYDLFLKKHLKEASTGKGKDIEMTIKSHSVDHK